MSAINVGSRRSLKMGWFRKKAPERAADEFHGIIVTLLIDGEQSLFIMLGADGSISRVGTGTLDNTARDMFIGRTEPALFRSLREQITPELLAWCDQSRADPEPQGKVCELTVGFKRSSGEELLTAWRYGSESMGPPLEVGQFVVAAVQATDPWFAQQQTMVRGE
jgi:hypothetical protein